MKIAVLSGKGGTGKTFVSISLALTAASACYVDCDVEEPNGHLFLRPQNVVSRPVTKLLPTFAAEKCTGCRKCVDFCRFNALAYIGKSPMVFKDVCHSCGGCLLVCPSEAATETPVEIGHIELGHRGKLEVASGFLNIGEASGIGIIQALLQIAEGSEAEHVIIDCPPGSACSVVESVKDADFCLIVAEPTQFGAHNFEMVAELVQVLKKPCAVVVNKANDEDVRIDALCAARGLSVLAHIPYRAETAKQGAEGALSIEIDPTMHQQFTALWRKILEGSVSV